tara:strand:+ start:968 stop:3004 length:2037 start_codon:yes stop_codon:yes gene_type:complete
MTISTIVDGVDSYYNINASGFIIGGGAQESQEIVVVDGVIRLQHIFIGGNVDSGVSKVVFTNNGVIGQPDNTVNVAVHLNTAVTDLPGWPSDQNLYVDIDERSSEPPVQESDRVFCIKAYWPYFDNQAVTMADLNANNTQHVITEAITQGSAMVQPSSSHQGNIPNNTTTEVARLTFAAASGYYYLATPSLDFASLGGYSDYYSSVYTPTFDQTTGAIISFVMQMYYTPPSSPGLYPDPHVDAVKMCQLSHAVYVRSALKQIQVAEVNHVSSVGFESEIVSSGGSSRISVEGTSGAKFILQVQKNENLTSPQPALSGTYFDFLNNSWVDNRPINQFEIKSGYTTSINNVNYEPTTSDVNFRIWVQEFEGSTLHPQVPTIGIPGKVRQYGLHDVTINPYSADSTVFAAFPTKVISRKKLVKDEVNSTSVSIFATGGNGNSSSTKVILQTPVPLNVAPGQIVTVRNTVNASIIPHNTTVVSLRGTVLTLSAAAAIPDGTEIRFDNNDSSLEAFDFTITAGTSRNVAPIADKDMRTIVSGIGDRVGKIGGGSSGTTVGFTSGVGPTATADGIAVGAKMTGAEVAGDIDSAGTVFTIVTAVNTLANTITVAHTQVSALTGVSLTFSNSDTFTANSGVELIDAQVSAVDVNNVKLQGYFKIKRLDATGTIALNIDKIITNTAE